MKEGEEEEEEGERRRRKKKHSSKLHIPQSNSYLSVGYYCEIALNPCDSSPCVHGYCVNYHHSYECICQDGWNGTHCNENIDECASDPCHHGNCTDMVDGFFCTCQPYYTGMSFRVHSFLSSYNKSMPEFLSFNDSWFQ